MHAHSVLSDSCKAVDCNSPGSSVHGIFQTRILMWVAISFSRAFSQPRGRTTSAVLAGVLFVTEPPGKPTSLYRLSGPSCGLSPQPHTQLILSSSLSSPTAPAESLKAAASSSVWFSTPSPPFVASLAPPSPVLHDIISELL